MSDRHDDLGPGLGGAAGPAGGVAGLLASALAGEPPLVDLVAAAQEGARRRQARDRLVLAVAPVLVAALGIAGYALMPRASGRGETGAQFAMPGLNPLSIPPAELGPDPTPTPVDMCAHLRADPSPNTIPATDAQAVYLCDLTLDTLQQVLPGARLSFTALGDSGGPSGVWGEQNQLDVSTDRGIATLGIMYLWPAKDKGQDPENTDTTCPAGTADSCVRTTPAPRLVGRLTTQGDGQVEYMIDDVRGGRYIITVQARTSGDAAAFGPKVPAAPYTPQQYRAIFQDPRFGLYLRQYADYVLERSPMKWPEGAMYKGHLG